MVALSNPRYHADVHGVAFGDRGQRFAARAALQRFLTLVGRELGLAAEFDAVRNRPEAVQETKTAEPVSAVDPMWAPMPRGPEAKTTKSIDRPKFTGCPPGVEMSRRSRMTAAASQRRAASRMARGDVRRPHHQGWSAARNVGELHHTQIHVLGPDCQLGGRKECGHEANTLRTNS